jgi:hypothetical protein
VSEDLLDSVFFKAFTLHILRLRLEEDLFSRSFCQMSTMEILCLLVLIPHRKGD